MDLFYSSVRELVESGNIETLTRFKKQIESDLERIGNEERLMERYEFLGKALSLMYERKIA